jgi:hypothetical protein
VMVVRFRLTTQSTTDMDEIYLTDATAHRYWYYSTYYWGLAIGDTIWNLNA